MNTVSFGNWGRFLWLIVMLPLTACHSSKPSDEGTRSYAAQGVIEEISPDQKQATIHHQAIPGYMMEMTMDFPVNDPAELRGLSPGAKITFTLNVNRDRAWITDIRCLGYSGETARTMSMADDAVPRLKPGDMLPDIEITTEDGRTIQFSDFHGKAVAFTFFFTRCPLPNYCPLMNRNFAQTRKLLRSDAKTANWQLLSISFDSKFDNAENLASYASFYRENNADHWLFASASPAALGEIAPRIGLMIMGEDGNISHNLRTVVIDPQGRLYRQFNDNLWTPRQLADAILEASRLSKAGS